jgi:hypothetical protein
MSIDQPVMPATTPKAVKQPILSPKLLMGTPISICSMLKIEIHAETTAIITYKRNRIMLIIEQAFMKRNPKMYANEASRIRSKADRVDTVILCKLVTIPSEKPILVTPTGVSRKLKSVISDARMVNILSARAIRNLYRIFI